VRAKLDGVDIPLIDFHAERPHTRGADIGSGRLRSGHARCLDQLLEEPDQRRSLHFHALQQARLHCVQIITHCCHPIANTTGHPPSPLMVPPDGRPASYGSLLQLLQ